MFLRPVPSPLGPKGFKPPTLSQLYAAVSSPDQRGWLDALQVTAVLSIFGKAGRGGGDGNVPPVEECGLFEMLTCLAQWICCISNKQSWDACWVVNGGREGIVSYLSPPEVCSFLCRLWVRASFGPLGSARISPLFPVAAGPFFCRACLSAFCPR